MSLLHVLPKLLEESKIEYENCPVTEFIRKEVFSQEATTPDNILAKGNNLDFMKYMSDSEEWRGKLNLVYIDPPFYSQADYGVNLEFHTGTEKTKIKGKAYSDTWEQGMADYLKMLCTRFFAIRDLLAEDGCLWVHLDWHSVHYVKILLDEIFGEKNFVNEIVWQYKSGGTSKRHFSRKHDTLLFYGKSGKYYFNPQQEKSYNRGMKPYRFKGVKEYRDEIGWHTLVNMKDVWQLDMVGRTAKERTGYATQKPEALVERILESCTKPGDLCADFFSGSGTLAATADKMNRRWVCCDQGNLAIIHSISRLAGQQSSFSYLEEENLEEALYSNEDILVNIQVEQLDERLHLIEIELMDFKPELICPHEMSDKDKKNLEKILRKDALRLVEYWSVDYSYDGIVHRPRDVFFKESEIIHRKSKNIGADFAEISIRLLDSLGRSYHRVIRLQGGQYGKNKEDK